ncbi:MAG: hypothetical protein KDA81_14510, partial [Planctomycetaceae bacterium]|nr:hypothetical protein [Planctomycetaceae bacterium]
TGPTVPEESDVQSDALKGSPSTPATVAEASATSSMSDVKREVTTGVVTQNSEKTAEADSTTAIVPAVAKGETGKNTLTTSEAGDDSGSPTVQASAVMEKSSTDPTSLGTEAGPDEEASAEPREIKLLIAEKTFRPAAKDTDAIRVSYDDIDLLKILNMEPVPVNAAEHFPQWLNDLNGRRVRIRGFMYPTFEATGLKAFHMARDNGICCFVRQPKIYDIIGVKLAQGQTTDYIEGKPFDVEGTFLIAPEADSEELFQLYKIVDAFVVK